MKTAKIFLLSVAVLGLLMSNGQRAVAQNDVMMQAFYWNVPVDEANHNGTWWDVLRQKAPDLKASGITGIWVPCPAKGNWGITDMGYGIYDHYDLGNYNQKGSVETRFGSRAELASMISTMHQSPKIEVYADVVLNHVYSSDENSEVNPAVKAYEFGEAHNGANTAYPTNEIKWVVPNAAVGTYYIQIKGFNLNWSADYKARGYDVNINWTGAATVENGRWESEPNNGGGQSNVFSVSGETLRAHIDYSGDIDEYAVTVTSPHDIVITLTARTEGTNPFSWNWADQTNGYYPVAIWYNGANLATTTLQAKTNTHITYVTHTGSGEPNYTWNYSYFHPSDANDWLGGPGTDEIITNTKFFGNDFNTFNSTVQSRLNAWGSWLAGTVGFDGFRLDFVRGFQESFVASWVSNLPLLDGRQRFVVGEYWGSDYRIKSWVNTVAADGADVDGFDFPLKSTLTSMCNDTQTSFNMAWLNHAGMVRNSSGNSLPGTSVVTFVDNHDTGKESDKWVNKDFKMAYAYILTHEGRPCIFYPHFYGVTQVDANNSSLTVTAPSTLYSDIKKLIAIRKTYLGGSLAVLSEVGNPSPSGDTYNVYVARRQGNGTKSGAIIVLNNASTTKGLWVDVTPSGYQNWAGLTLVNALNGTETVQVYADGRAYFSAPARGYSIWVKQSEYTALQASPKQPLTNEVVDNQQVATMGISPNPVNDASQIEINSPKESIASVALYDLSGRLVRSIASEKSIVGQAIFPLDCAGLANGTYFCIALVGGKKLQSKVVVSR